MAKYRAKEDIPPKVKKGDIVELTEDPVPGMKERLEPVSDSEAVTTDDETADLLTGLSRDELKAKADELGVDYPGNISTAKLLEAVKEKMAEDEAAGEGTDGNDNPDD